MDPNANLAELRTLLKSWEAGGDTPPDYDRAMDLMIALDEWITNGGALPAAWGR